MKRLATMLLIMVLMACSESAPGGGSVGSGDGSGQSESGSGSSGSSGNTSTSGGTTSGSDAPPSDVTVPPADTTQPPTAPPPAPAISTEFVANDVPWTLQLGVPNAKVDFGVADAAAGDGKSVQLLWPGLNNGGSADNKGPYPHATQIATADKSVGFGTYRARVKLARCAATEEVVNGIFVYAHDGSDTNGNGIEDNTEIDIEILCGEPQFINMTVWTDYQDATAAKPAAIRRTGRVIDTKTGEVTELAAPDKDGKFLKVDPTLIIPGFPKDHYYELGFDWQAKSVRFFIVIDGKELTLWEFTDASAPSLIPQTKAAMMFNLWYSKSHWNKTPAPAAYAAENAIMSVDWFKYWK